MINTPYISSAPVYDKFLDKDGNMVESWQNFNKAIPENLGYVVVQDRFNDTKQATPLTVVLQMSEDRRDQLENAIDGAVIYNTDTMRINFRENGAWVTYTPIPA